MNKEEIMVGRNLIPDGMANQIIVSEKLDEECLIWINPKALNMANKIDFYKQMIDKLYKFINSKDFEQQFESKNNALYVRTKIKDIIGFTMNLKEFEILKGDGNE